MTATGSIVAVPWARAPMDAAPPTAYTSSMPSNAAVAITVAFGRPSEPGGVTTAMRSTPAASAGTAVMMSVDG